MAKAFWNTLLAIVFIALIIDLIVPDPLPFVDEVVLIALNIFTVIKAVREDKK